VKNETLEPLLKQIGLKLTELRIAKGYKSHETFAYDFDLPRMHYWRIENGRTNITLKTLLRILSIHKMGFEDFVSELSKVPKKAKKTKAKG
jgi:transcriptional regulator with XRE-family HTH domain